MAHDCIFFHFLSNSGHFKGLEGPDYFHLPLTGTLGCQLKYQNTKVGKQTRMGYTRFCPTILYQYYTGGKIGKTILYAIPILYQIGTAELKS